MTHDVDELIQAGNELLERLNLWLQGDGDICYSAGGPCWNNDGGTVDADDLDNPARCTVCGVQCDCSRCNDLEAIVRWKAATRNA